MRTTVTIDDDLHAVLLSLAHHNNRSLSQTVAALLRRGLQSGTGRGRGLETDPETGFPLLRSDRPITADDVRSLEDEP